MPRKRVNKGQLEIGSKISDDSGARKPKPRKKVKRRGITFTDSKPDKGWMIAGFDVAMTNISGAAIAYDAILKKLKGPVFVTKRWTKEDHYYDRLGAAARAYDFVLELQGQLLLSLPLEKIFIAEEEPWPFGFVKRNKGETGWMKQQAEISGAFLSGLLRYGFQNVTQMNSIHWRKMVADELGITTHFSKWQDPALCEVYNCLPKDTGKFRAKQWAVNNGYAFQGVFSEEVPDWPDLIKHQKLGTIARPDGSRAKSFQPDDRYDALAICFTHYLELGKDGIIG